jgi:acyloxyacyl hydrolase
MRNIAFAAALVGLCFAVAVDASIFGTRKGSFPFGPLTSRNGGSDCAACTLIVALVEQQMQIKKVNASESMELLCSYLPLGSTLDGLCEFAVELFGGTIESLLNQGESADTVCNAINMCKDTAPVCRLFPAKKGRSNAMHAAHIVAIRKHFAAQHASVTGQKFNVCTIVPAVCKVEDHLPFFDTDGDRFSTAPTLRGTDWRGTDCDDYNSTIFPGRDSNDALGDYNCNNISGVDATSGMTYEDAWCKGTGAMGVAALGDSATAHFHIPPTYMTAADLSKATFANVIRDIENELDWPMLSWSTGHLDPNNFMPDISGPRGSLYTHMLADNLCMYNDFQNIGVNGAKVSNLNDFALLLSRNASAAPVKPLFLIMSMIGNDVCHWTHTFDTMTKPAEYKASVLQALRTADEFMPAGSQVLLIPLVDGRILYDVMHNRIHPIGSTNKDVTYADLYDYLNCLEVSPCWGWMNSNETVRNGTWAIAESLNEQLPAIVQETQGTFKNFNVSYLGNVFDDALKKFEMEFPGEGWKLIEPVDGFHPSQMANALLGYYLYNATKQAGLLPPVNPNNALIQQQFGIHA